MNSKMEIFWYLYVINFSIEIGQNLTSDHKMHGKVPPFHPLLLGVLDDKRRTECLGEYVINVLISQFPLKILWVNKFLKINKF